MNLEILVRVSLEEVAGAMIGLAPMSSGPFHRRWKVVTPDRNDYVVATGGTPRPERERNIEVA